MATQPTAKATWVRLLDDGRYDFGFIERAVDRRKDRMVRLGSCGSYAAAMMLAAYARAEAQA